MQGALLRWFPPNFFFAWAFPAGSQSGPPRHQRRTNRGGCHCQPGAGRVIVGCGYRPGAAATETDTHRSVLDRSTEQTEYSIRIIYSLFDIKLNPR